MFTITSEGDQVNLDADSSFWNRILSVHLDSDDITEQFKQALNGGQVHVTLTQTDFAMEHREAIKVLLSNK